MLTGIRLRVGVDTGGTFTDVVGVATNGEWLVRKVPAGTDALAGVALEELVYSTTLATNAVLTRTGAEAALVTTAGFEDVLELARQERPQLYALAPLKAAPLLPRARRLGVAERVGPDGEVLLALDDAEVARVVAAVRALGVGSVAVCLLHGHAWPAHERRLGAALAAAGLTVSLSSTVSPAAREYERTATTVVDAWVKPLMAPHLDGLARRSGPVARRLIDGLRAPRVWIFGSHGAALPRAEAAARPVRTLLSGPAAGVAGAARLAAAAGLGDFISVDVGGTSTDVALVRGGAVALTLDGAVGGVPLQLPMLEIHTIGAGGGSVARVDEGGALRVGPASQGARPGPACYGRGGTLPTVTDAALALGRAPARLGDSVVLDREAALRALATLAGPLGLSVEETAAAIIAVAEAHMVRAIRVISVERGVDLAGAFGPPTGKPVDLAGAFGPPTGKPVDLAGAFGPPTGKPVDLAGAFGPPTGKPVDLAGAFGPPTGKPVDPATLALVAFGGAGPAHAVGLARALGITRVWIPPEPGLVCAWGALAADVVLQAEQPIGHVLASLPALDDARRGLRAKLDDSALPAPPREDFVGELRYRGQATTLPVAVGEDLAARFAAAHTARYGYDLGHDPAGIELVSVRLTLTAARAGVPMMRGERVPGTTTPGPAVLADYSATTWLPDGAHAVVDALGGLAITP